MALVNFTNLDFDQIKSSIREYLRANSNFTDYDFEGSNLSTLVDVLAYNTYISSYNANMISNEVFIDSATLRENVVSLARNIGYVPHSNIDIDSINVFVRDTQASTIKSSFKLSRNLFNIDSESRVFFIQEIEDQRYELIFGDGIFGKKLNNLNYIEVSYNITNGESANGVSSFNFNGRILDNNNRVVTTGISLITTNLSSQNGREIESVESIKKYAPRKYSSQNRAVTATDYETIIPTIYPEAESISVFGGEDLNPPKYGRVFISIKPINGPFVSNQVKDNIKSSLRRYSVAGIVPEIIDLR